MADKFLQHDASGGLREVEGAAVGGGGSANKIAALDATGRFDPTMMPTGIGAETASIECTENVAAGDLVNIYENNGAIRVRRADSSSAATYANGFVQGAFTSGQNATVFFSGIISGLSGLTPGKAFLGNTAGSSTHLAPTAAGNIVQKVGVALTADTLYFAPQEPILLA